MNTLLHNNTLNDHNITLLPSQQTILDNVPALITDGKSVIIEARAGSGKTFILTRLARLLPPDGLCLAFNKDIVTELTEKMPTHILTKTFHAIGFTLLRDRLQTVRIDFKKLSTLASKLRLSPAYPYCQAVDALKTYGYGLNGLPPLTPNEIIDLVSSISIQIPSSVTPDAFANGVLKLFKRSLRDTSTINFADMLYLPLYLAEKHRWTFDKYPYILVDEAQDVSPIRLRLLTSLTDTIIAVGDPFQSIYHFAGASATALDDIATRYNPTTYTLPYSFRCPSTITSLASDLISPASILSLPDAPVGSITDTTLPTSWLPTSPDEAVLCRTNQPLFVLALRLLRDGQPFIFRSDFPTQLISLVKRFKASNHLELQTRISAWLDQQIDLFNNGKIKKGALILAQEKHDTILYLITQTESPENLILTLNQLMLTDVLRLSAPTLSTIHKAKGLEWDTVYILRPDLLPAPFATTETDLEQERNIEYVAVTRAKNRLIYITGFKAST